LAAQDTTGTDAHGRDHTHDHALGHEDGHDHEHDHEHDSGLLGRLREMVPFLHDHNHGEANIDSALESSDRGIWALKISLFGLGATAIFQVIIFLMSGSVALLADTIHNFSDALTAVPLWIAFSLSKRGASRRYTYGYGRAEDLAGVFIVLMIGLSAAIAGYESIRKLLDPQPLSNAWWVVAAAIIGFIGNEAVAIFRIRVGKEIGSAALVADGQHARADGFTSLAVLLGAVGSLLGFPLADPIVGLLITAAILFILRDATLPVWQRLVDAVDPELVDAIEEAAAKVEGVEEVHATRVRWLGHTLQGEMHITVDEDLPTRESHRIVEEVRHAVFHDQPRLAELVVHVDPCGHSGTDHHRLTADHVRRY
jgi:cation diffusion facilitator family transporter